MTQIDNFSHLLKRKRITFDRWFDSMGFKTENDIKLWIASEGSNYFLDEDFYTGIVTIYPMFHDSISSEEQNNKTFVQEQIVSLLDMQEKVGHEESTMQDPTNSEQTIENAQNDALANLASLEAAKNIELSLEQVSSEENQEEQPKRKNRKQVQTTD